MKRTKRRNLLARTNRYITNSSLQQAQARSHLNKMFTYHFANLDRHIKEELLGEKNLIMDVLASCK